MENYNDAFYVYGEDVSKGWDSKFVSWLNSEGFNYSGRKGFYGGNYIWINVNNKTFTFNVPGCRLANRIGDCIVYEADFKTIYNILKNSPKSQTDIFINKLDNIFVKSGLPKPKYVEKTGYFTIVGRRERNDRKS